MFTTDVTTGFSYLRPGSLQPLYHFELCGTLFALAIYNGISIPVNFPEAFYAHLIHPTKAGIFEKVTSSIEDHWPAIAKSLDHMLADDVPGIEFSYPMEANGLRLTVLPYLRQWSPVDRSRIPLTVVEATPIFHHPEQSNSRDAQATTKSERTVVVDIDSLKYAWPGWYITKNTDTVYEVTRERVLAYTELYKRWITFGCVEPQWDAFLKGFHAVLPDFEEESFLTPLQLRVIVEGSTHLDINELRAVTTYEGYDPASRYIQNFWRMVTGWDEDKQKQLLKFVTAAERIPAGGAAHLTFKIARSYPEEGRGIPLPTSSTCFGQLLLPKYRSVEVMEEKLSQALAYGLEGFGNG